MILIVHPPHCLKSAPLIAQTQPLFQQFCHSLPQAPHLVVLIAGNHEPSKIYVAHKKKMAQAIGIKVTICELDSDLSQKDLNAICSRYNNDPDCHGILIQLPIPMHWDLQEALHHISPMKDVDGLTTINQGYLAQGNLFKGLLPCTPWGVIRLLHFYSIPLAGRRVLVLGRSILVGRPMALCVLAYDATVTIAHSKTYELKSLLKSNDIIISATGQQGLITWQDCTSDQIIIDIGIHRSPQGTIHGDLGPYNEMTPKAKAFSPVPGGIGPMTINTLLWNTLKAYCLQNGHEWQDFEKLTLALRYIP